MAYLAAAQKEAIELLLSLPVDRPTAEMSIAGIEDPTVWLGMGWLVGKGWAVYRGGYSFRFGENGRQQAIGWLAENDAIAPSTKGE